MNENNIEVLAPSATMALERAAIDGQIATAHAYPRSLEQFKKRATGMATLDLQTAESCIYSRPVGGGKVAEGASIRLAEIVAASYGNLRVASRIVEQTARYVKCEGVAHDLESNYAGKSECIEATVKQDGSPYSESQRAVVAKACLAKAYRDAVFKVVPKALCKSVIEAANGVIKKEVATIEQRRDRAKSWLKQIKVDDNRVFSMLQVKGWSEVTDDHLAMLTGLKTAINEQDTTIEEAFPQAAKTPNFGPGDAPKQAEKAAGATAGEKASTKKETAPQQAAAKQAPANPEQKASETGSGDDGDLGPQTAAAPAAPAEQPQGEFKPTPGDSDAVANIRFLLHKNGLSEGQFISWATKNKIARGEAKLVDFTANARDKKLVGVGQSWDNIVNDIRQEPKE